jgi:glycosyltransferase involved in cell wall biosynthesis
VVTIDNYARQQILDHGVPAERVTTVYPPVWTADALPTGVRSSVRAELGIPAQAQVVGIGARLHPEKGQADAITAFARVAHRHPGAYLLVVGDTIGQAWGTPRAELEAHACRVGVGPRVVFTGHRADFGRLLAAMDVFLHPARGDTISLGPLEASSIGLPVVGYAEGGLLESVLEGVTGRLVPTGNVAALAGAIDELLTAPELARRWGRAGRLYVQTTFAPATWGQVFAEVLSAASCSRGAPSTRRGQARATPLLAAGNRISTPSARLSQRGPF